MISSIQSGRSATPSYPRAKRRPSPRNAQIFEAVRVNGEKQAVVAARYGLSQRRVSAICTQVDEFQRWVRSAPNAEELATEERRRNLHQGRRRAELLFVTALRQAVQTRQQLVTETRRVAGGQEVVERTVREEPIDVQWLKLASQLYRDVVQINVKIGPDAESSLAASEVDALLADGLLAGTVEAGVEKEYAGDSGQTPKEGAKYSGSSTDAQDSSPIGATISPGNSSVNDCETIACVETGSFQSGLKDEKKSVPDKVFYDTEHKGPQAQRESPQIAQTTRSKLPREVRERRARFLQSSPEPRADEMRLVRSRPR